MPRTQRYGSGTYLSSTMMANPGPWPLFVLLSNMNGLWCNVAVGVAVGRDRLQALAARGARRLRTSIDLRGRVQVVNGAGPRRAVDG